MPMKVDGSYSHYKTDHADYLKAGQERPKEAAGAKDGKVSDKIPVLQDEYVSSEKSSAKPSGLYRVGQDGNGNRKVFYKGGGKPKVNPGDPEKSAEKCTGNTDKADREIRELKEKKKQLEQQIKAVSKAASKEAKKARELEKELEQVKRELDQKDNDTYRRQHTSFSG